MRVVCCVVSHPLRDDINIDQTLRRKPRLREPGIGERHTVRAMLHFPADMTKHGDYKYNASHVVQLDAFIRMKHANADDVVISLRTSKQCANGSNNYANPTQPALLVHTLLLQSSNIS